jgi:hypothetical protein
MTSPTPNSQPFASRSFPTVWYLPDENRWSDLKVLAYRDVGKVIVEQGRIEFHGGKETVIITDIRRVSYGKQGRDFVNNWVKVEYVRNQIALTAFFADGSLLGWGGIFGGTKRIFEVMALLGQNRG